MRRSYSTNPSGTETTPDNQEVKAAIERLPSGKFRVVVHFGFHPVNGKLLRLTRTFDTEREAIIFRDTLLQKPSSALASLRDQLEIAALPSPPDHPEWRMYLIRGQQVMLDADVAQLLGTRTGLLNQAVNRNRRRFPDDFAFHLTREEAARLRNLGGSNPTGHGGRRTLPRVFTDLGLVMAAAILKSPMAVNLNLEVIRALNAATHTPEPSGSGESEE